MKLKLLAHILCCTSLAAPVWAQPSTPAADAAWDAEPIIVTGSRIKRNVQDSPLPLQIFTSEDLTRESINSPEQFIALLSSNGNGLDNLASNADVVGGAQRGNNGASSANLRGQGAAATLILLNGRRVPAHGLNGGVVDINQIPLFAVERIEVLKDGASAIYGTDAVGGVINFITRTSYEGVGAQGFMDVTEAGGGNIFRGSVMAGHGNLDTDRFNIMGAISISENKALRGDQRGFVDTFQPNRGLSVDTRGTPFATIFPLGANPAFPGGTIIPSAATAPFLPGSTTVRAGGGINVLDLPGNLGCNSIAGQDAYDPLLWNLASAEFACAWDTGRAAVLQQPLRTVSWLTRGTLRLGDHQISAELTGSDADAAKRFSNAQISSNTTTQAFAYPRTAANAAVYDRVFNDLVAVFPTLEARRGLPMGVRWRCIECGPREIETNTKTLRATLGAEGPIAGDWEYRAGVSYGYSESQSTLGGGYHYRNTVRDVNGNIIANGLIDALNTGVINLFLRPGETQTPEAMALLESTSARGVTLFGGKHALWQVDASAAGSLFELPGGTAKAAFGADFRKEQYSFNGDARAAAARPFILLAPFDDANALAGVSRDIMAAYTEVLLPIFDGFELTGAFRIDEYTGFGTTTNPKISAKYRPARQLLFRGSYNTSFRVPSFNQIFNGTLESPYAGRDLADPATCPGGQADETIPGCSVVTGLTILTGGKPDLGPETARQFSLGVVFEPSRQFFVSLDWWRIEREGNIRVLPLQDLVANAGLFPERFIRGTGGNLLAIDNRWVNSGGTDTEGLELSVRGSGDVWGGEWGFGLDGSYLIAKRSRLTENAAWGPSEVGRFTFAGDLGLRWKHNAFLTFARDDWTASFSQIFRKGYTNQELPGVTAGRVSPPDLVEKTADYVTYNMSVSYRGFDRFTITGGIRNLFDQDPPFAINYDSNFGSGSSWEPRVADPRGRSFTLLLDFRF
ncbi:MAG: TonB-dependent receptor [Sandarakinorhabdus sp.]|nr:TonB-dependent receptor [Sandarakinorhabdus sp.]